MEGNRFRPSYPAVVCTLYVALLTILVAISIAMSDGHLIYSLDDPYIHLALAENIIRGVYGVNLSEYSSPSSSIIYPLFLSATEFLRLGSLGPLFIGGLAGMASVYHVCRFIEQNLATPSVDTGGKLFLYAATLLLILCMSALALPMTGMEHSVHVLLVVIVLTGLAGVLEGRGVSAALGVATVLTPLIRFEGAALSGAVIIALWLLGHRRAAVVIALAVLVAVSAYFAGMAALGLPLLPSSVLVKSPVAAAAVDSGGSHALLLLAGNLFHSVTRWEGLVLAAMLAGLVIGWRRSPPEERSGARTMAAVAGAAIAAHMIAGQYNWFHRYEVYANTIGLVALIYVFRTPLKRMIEERSWLPRILTLGALALVAVPYAYATVRTPFAARGIYDQQFQMHRFAADVYNRPVAVNDLGLVSYRNDNFVLDLWGLGSERVRRLKRANAFDATQIDRLARDYHVGVAMVFEPWFQGGLPRDWRRVAVLRTRGAFAACDRVTFFVTPTGNLDQVNAALLKLKPTLPARDSLDIGPDASPARCK